MDSSFIEAIKDSAKVCLHELDGRQYATKPLSMVQPPEPAPLVVNSLSAIENYCQKQLDPLKEYILHIEGPRRVSLLGTLDIGYRMREVLLRADCPYETFSFGKKMGLEMFAINLQAQFCQTDATKNLLQVVSSVETDEGVSVDDDGVSQRVTVKKGVSLKGNAKVANPLNLFPYRTFPDVDQPGGPFVFRFDSNFNCSLHEADGGVWQVEAVQNIKNYFQEKLSSLISENMITLVG